MNSNNYNAIREIDRLTVRYHGQRVGELMMAPNSKVCLFRYDAEWLATGFSISPLDLPLKTEIFSAKPIPFNGNFGIFEDSLPDGYGCYLLDRILRKHGIDIKELTPIQWLCIVGDAGMGALTYEPSIVHADAHILPALDSVQDLALEVLTQKNSDDVDVLYFNSGNSGGCRPKCLYTDESGNWLVKFRHTYDSPDIGVMEYEYAVAAKESGITMPQFKLIEGKYFASKRFDLDDNGERIHMATAAALLNESIFPPKTDYATLLQLTGFLTQNASDVEQMYRRMVFNVLADNKDDHAKNFTFLCKDGQWSLAPAYDLTYSPTGYNEEHATSVNYVGNPSRNDLISAASAVRISSTIAQRIIDEVSTAITTHLSKYLKK